MPVLRDLASRVARGILKDNCDGYAARMVLYFTFALFTFLLLQTALLACLPVPGLLRLLLPELPPGPDDD